MSCRPRGPSDRPFYDYYELELGGNQAPRLPTQSLGSRLLIAGVVVCCCGIVALSLLFALSLVANSPHLPTAGAFGPGAALVSIEQRTGPASPPPATRRAQRSVLARLATLKRAQPPATGADYHSMQIAFPHWFELDGDRSQARPVHALPDIALALSYLAQEDAHSRGQST
jgi:hypothetical protein